MPATVVIETNKSLTNNESLAVIDQLTENLRHMKGLKQVSSVTDTFMNLFSRKKENRVSFEEKAI